VGTGVLARSNKKKIDTREYKGLSTVGPNPGRRMIQTLPPCLGQKGEDPKGVLASGTKPVTKGGGNSGRKGPIRRVLVKLCTGRK